jgi:hypothetical protein
MNTERDKYLTEAMGLKWKQEIPGVRYGMFGPPENINFDSPDGFFKLWNWAQGQEWWTEFQKKISYRVQEWSDVYHAVLSNYAGIQPQYIHPTRFADAVYDYLRAK